MSDMANRVQGQEVERMTNLPAWALFFFHQSAPVDPFRDDQQHRSLGDLLVIALAKLDLLKDYEPASATAFVVFIRKIGTQPSCGHNGRGRRWGVSTSASLDH